MKIYEFRSDISDYENVSETSLTVETELFLTKQKAVDYMRAKAIEYENANIREKFYGNVEGYPNDSEGIELYSSRNSDVFGLFSVDEREVNE